MKKLFLSNKNRPELFFGRFLLRALFFIVLQIVTMNIYLNAQTISLNATVVDDATGEPLPYASIYVSPEVGSMTNDAGVFHLELEQGQRIRISYVGYETLHTSVAAGEQTYRLRPLTANMNEITVLPKEDIMLNVAKRLYKEFRWKKNKDSDYFYRLTHSFSGNTEMVEAFLRGHSAISLRDYKFYSGRRIRQTRYSRTESKISYSDMVHFNELSPMTVGTSFWSTAMLPMFIKKYLKLTVYQVTGDDIHFNDRPYGVSYFAYHTSVKEATSSNGNRIYCIEMRRKDGLDYPIVDGTLYVDAEDYRLLSFEGKISNLMMNVGIDFHNQSHHIKPEIKIQYKHDNGFTEVDNIVAYMEMGDMKTRSVLYNMQKRKLPFKKRKAQSGDLISAIDATGYDPEQWKDEIVHRTVEEQHLAWFATLSAKEQEEWISANIDTTFAFAGEFKPLVKRLANFGQAIPQEKVYVHMDNTSYMLGDTIWFKAYTRQTNNNRPSNISGVLYAELWNHDGYLVERKMIEMNHGSGHGYFVLNPQMQYAGFYELRAYTRWQLNWGVFEHKHSRIASQWFPNKEMEKRFYRDYHKLYSRTFPVYDQPDSPESQSRYMTMRTFRRTFKKEQDKRKLTLTLYPEGGTPVAGTPCRTAFEAAWSDGQWVEGWLHIGKDSVPATNRGRGVFTYTPVAGEKLSVIFKTKNGETAEAKSLRGEPDGVALQIRQNETGWTIESRIGGNLSADSLAITVMHQGKLLKFWNRVGEPFTLPVSALESGVHQVTVFDTQGRVYADRLFFNYTSADNRPTVKIDGIKDSYAPFQPIELQVSTDNAGSSMSLAVRDANVMDKTFDNGNILTEMLLASEIKGFVPDPGWYFQTDNKERRQALDLLMMTQGWRRFDWRSMAVRGVWDLTQPDEKAPILIGKVYDSEISDYNFHLQDNNDTTLIYETPRKNFDIKREVRVRAELQPLASVNKDSAVLYLDKIVVLERETKGHKFRLQLPKMYDKNILFLAASDTTKWKKGKEHIWIQGSRDNKVLSKKHQKRKELQPAEFSVKVDFHYPRFVKPYTFHQTHIMDTSIEEEKTGNTLLSDGTTQMKEVEVKGKRNVWRRFNDEYPVAIIDAEVARNMEFDDGLPLARIFVGDFGSDFPYASWDDPGRSLSRDRIYNRYAWNANRRRNKGLSIHPDSIYLRSQLYSFHESYLKNFPPTSMEYQEYTDAHATDKYVIYTDYCPRLEGSNRYKGDKLPETNVVRYNFNVTGEYKLRMIYRDRRFFMEGFAYPAECYSPDYSKQTPPDSVKDYRRTLYWNPNLMLDKDGKATVTLYNNARTTQISVDAAGQAADGTLLWGFE